MCLGQCSNSRNRLTGERRWRHRRCERCRWGAGTFRLGFASDGYPVCRDAIDEVRDDAVLAALNVGVQDKKSHRAVAVLGQMSDGACVAGGEDVRSELVGVDLDVNLAAAEAGCLDVHAAAFGERAEGHGVSIADCLMPLKDSLSVAKFG